MQPEGIQKDVKNQLASPKTILHNEDTKKRCKKHFTVHNNDIPFLWLKLMTNLSKIELQNYSLQNLISWYYVNRNAWYFNQLKLFQSRFITWWFIKQGLIKRKGKTYGRFILTDNIKRHFPFQPHSRNFIYAQILHNFAWYQKNIESKLSLPVTQKCILFFENTVCWT